MKVLLVGGGGREHALAWKISQSPLLSQLYCAPGNAGIARHARCLPIKADDIPGLCDFAQKEGVQLVVVGPEAPLVAGLTDHLQAIGIPVFGPSQAAAQIEGSKAFMKDLFARYRIPSAPYQTFTQAEAALAYIRRQGAPIVVKTSGLAAGKGVIVCTTLEEAEEAIHRIMHQHEFGPAGTEVVVEAFLHGEEASFLALVDGEHILPLAGAQDHKAIGDGDRGPNTGGMGAYSPAPILDAALSQRVMREVMEPTVRAMAAEGRTYRGVLYAGLMIQDDRIMVLEFNARFGDPETQPILMRMRSDLLPLLLACANGSLQGMQIQWDPRPALCVVMAAGGYPGSYAKCDPIHGLEQAAELPEVQLFHAGTRWQEGAVVSDGGRVLGVTALGDTVAQAQQRAYEAVARISWSLAYCRRDIGYRAVAREAQQPL